METSRPSSFGGSTSSRRTSAESQASASSSSSSSASKFINNTEDIFNTNFNSSSDDGVRNNPDTLLNIAARYVGEKFPFQLLEERFNRIPEPVQKRVIFHSFPRSDKDIYMYSSFTHDSGANALPYHKGLQILETGGLVSNVLQIGFHLSGTVEGLPSESKDCLAVASGSHGGGKTKYRVSLSFDRCKITHCSCSCGAREIFWCEHIVALSLYRIRCANKVNLRVPISDQLLSLSRDQLQKLVQYIIADHQDVLPTAQNLTDQILTLNSDINCIQGAPDPTAGPSYSDRHSWAFDEDQVKEQVRTYLSQATSTSGVSTSYGQKANMQLQNLFAKVREMLNSRDSNAPRLLNLITHEFISDSRLHSPRTCSTSMTDKHRGLWDQLINLWVCICMNPQISDTERRANKKLLTKYANHPSCPMEDGYEHEDYYEGSSSSNDRDRDPGSSSSAKRRRKSKPKSVFHRAIECLETKWEFGRREHIKLREIPMECARVDALCSHGFKAEAVDVALSVLAHMKRFLRHAQDPKDPYHYHRSSYYGLLGHPLDCHTPVYNALYNSGHAAQAFEFSLLTLGEWRLMPLGVYSQEKATRCEVQIIKQLTDMVVTPELEKVLVQTSSSLLHNSSGLGSHIHPGSYPMHTFAKYLFIALQTIDPDLGYKIGMRALRLPFLDEVDGNGSSFFRRSNRWFILGEVENQQCDLASVMLNSAKYDAKKLDVILECCSLHVHSAAHLFLLAKDCLKLGGEIAGTPTCPGGSSCIANITGPWPPAHANWTTTGSSSRWMTSAASIGVSSSSSSSAAAGSLANENAAHGSTWRATTSASWPSLPSASGSSPWGSGSGSGGWSSTWAGSTKNVGLINVGFKLGLQVLRQTLRWASRKRTEMVRWIVGCACEVGLEGILHILRNWSELFTPAEAVGIIATCLMGINQPGNVMASGPELARIATIRARLLPLQLEDIAIHSRALAIECAKKDPPNCALSALGLCEADPLAFETAYQIVVDSSANCLNSQQLFNIARYMEGRSQMRAYKLALLAMENVHIGYNQDTHPAVTDIHWATSLYYSITPLPVHSQFIQLIVKNVQCANVLSEILRRACSSRDKSPQLNLLKESTMSAYIQTVHTRLTHISPRHYTDFIEFLSKAKESFTLAGDSGQFQSLTESIKTSYKGKKKLVFLVTERFG